jgi:hypothetical protein
VRLGGFTTKENVVILASVTQDAWSVFEEIIRQAGIFAL